MNGKWRVVLAITLPLSVVLIVAVVLDRSVEGVVSVITSTAAAIGGAKMLR